MIHIQGMFGHKEHYQTLIMVKRNKNNDLWNQGHAVNMPIQVLHPRSICPPIWIWRAHAIWWYQWQWHYQWAMTTTMGMGTPPHISIDTPSSISKGITFSILNKSAFFVSIKFFLSFVS